MSIEYYRRRDPLIEAIIFWPNNIPEIMEWLGPAFRGIVNLAPGNLSSATNDFPSIDLPDAVRDGIESGSQYNVLVIADTTGFKVVCEGQVIMKDPVLGYISAERDAIGEFYTKESINTNVGCAIDGK